ncbi:hypothetical protein [Colwellia sp. RSH04]|uniref:hypothetical protein n=1 Tax=Colwellia sp. RSH04 TaxID=2305464 RepID=UPI000E567858|nr:hypothetical protein [Colwellia sp. RSH04]RHW75251.1 hypothetical protein D1094_14085 [Colwellia sp. RSH04]
MNQVKGFTISIIIVLVVFVLTAVSTGILMGYIGFWKKPFIGAVAAFSVVVTGYISAPNHKQVACIVWFIMGALGAWFLAGDSFYPEDHEHAYQLSYIPLLSTYSSGFLAVLICLFWHKQPK